MKLPVFPRDYRIYVVFVVLIAALTVMMPRAKRFNYDYKKGSPWMYATITAPFDIPLLKTDAQLQQEKEAAGSGVVPYYRFSDEEVTVVLNGTEACRLGLLADLRPGIKDILLSIYTRGVLSDEDGVWTDENIPVIYIQKDKKATKSPLSEIYSVTEAQGELASGITKLKPTIDADSLCRISGLYDIIYPNLFFDSATTESVHDEMVNYISPTGGIIPMGQVIVSRGEVITAEIAQQLDSYKAEFGKNLEYEGPLYMAWLSNLMTAIILSLVLFITIFYTNPKVYFEFNRLIYLVAIYFLTVVITFVVEKTGHQNIYLVPYTLMALYLVAFFKKKVIFPVYMVSLLPLLLFTHNGIEAFFIYLAAGAVALLSFMRFNRSWQQFVTAFFVFITLTFGFMAFRLAEGIQYFNDYRSIVYLGLGSLLCVAGYPLIYLWERIFMLVSDTRLRELTDTNNKMIAELASKAPGTFQHSLQVMNMADAAARAIGANVDLVRCGALYHDIGKTSNPMCFIENDFSGENPFHKNLSPLESAQAIIRHVSDGVVLAEKAKLPEVIKAFIQTHHGTTCTAYFYNKFLQDGGNPEDVGKFDYLGPRPSTKEQSILMLCDSIEAASRTLKDFSTESISNFVENICNGKIDEGQFVEADISMKELFTVKSVLKDFLRQYHHARPVYPQNDKK